MAKKPWRRRIASLRSGIAPVDPTEELYEQGFAGPRIAQTEQEDEGEEERELPLRWAEIGAYAAGSSVLVCAVGVVSVLGSR